MTFAEIIAADLAGIEKDFGDPVFTWQGTDYACHASSPDTSTILEIGGMVVQADLVIAVRTEVFSGAIYPVSGQKVTFNSVDYRVITVRPEPISGAALNLICVAANRGV